MGKNNEKDNGYVVQQDNTRVKQPLVQKKFRKATPTEQIASYIQVFGYPEQSQLSQAPSRTKDEREMIRETQEAQQAQKRLKEKGQIIRENVGFVPLVGDALDLGITGYEVATDQAPPAMLGLSAIGFLPFGDLFKKGKNWARAKLISREMKDVVDGGQQYFGKVKYYGPTMGKTTAAKTNPDLVDFDDFTREAKEALAKELNISTRVLQSDPKYAQAYQEMLEKQLDSWRRNPLNANKTLVISKKGLADKNIYNNEPSIPDRQTFVQRQRNRGETDDANSNDWYNMLLKQNPNLRIDNRFVSEIEYNPHYIGFQPTQNSVKTQSGYPFTFQILQDTKDVEALKAFAKKYGYKLPKGIERYTGEMLDKEFKRILTQHNTFGRGVAANNIEEAEKFLTTAHSGSAGAMDGMPSGKTGIYTMNSLSPYGNYQGVVQRQLDFSGPRNTWITKNDTPYLSSDDASKQITLLKEQYMQKNPYQGQENYFDNMWKYLEDNNPEVFNSSGQIYKINDTNILKQVGVPGVVIHGGNPGEKVLNAVNIFTPYNINGKTSTRGFSHKAYKTGGKLIKRKIK